MSSTALQRLLDATSEVGALQRANPSPSSSSPFRRPDVTRAIGRAQVVLLSSHFERYLYEVNEEAVEHLIVCKVSVGKVPLELRLLHSRRPADDLAQIEWKRRENALREFAESESTLWKDEGELAQLDHARLLEWMKTPVSKSVARFFRQWGIEDIFEAVTRSASNSRDLRLRIDELVEKRNNIAHGDLTVEATHLDVSKYLGAVRKFASRADRRLGRCVAALSENHRPW